MLKCSTKTPFIPLDTLCRAMMSSFICLEWHSGTWHGVFPPRSIPFKIWLAWFRTPPPPPPSFTSLWYWPVILLGANCQLEQILLFFCDLSWQQGCSVHKPVTDWELLRLIVPMFFLPFFFSFLLMSSLWLNWSHCGAWTSQRTLYWIQTIRDKTSRGIQSYSHHILPILPFIQS